MWYEEPAACLCDDILQLLQLWWIISCECCVLLTTSTRHMKPAAVAYLCHAVTAVMPVDCAEIQRLRWTNLALWMRVWGWVWSSYSELFDSALSLPHFSPAFTELTSVNQEIYRADHNLWDYCTLRMEAANDEQTICMNTACGAREIYQNWYYGVTTYITKSLQTSGILIILFISSRRTSHKWC